MIHWEGTPEDVVAAAEFTIPPAGRYNVKLDNVKSRNEGPKGVWIVFEQSITSGPDKGFVFEEEFWMSNERGKSRFEGAKIGRIALCAGFDPGFKNTAETGPLTTAAFCAAWPVNKLEWSVEVEQVYLRKAWVDRNVNKGVVDDPSGGWGYESIEETETCLYPRWIECNTKAEQDAWAEQGGRTFSKLSPIPSRSVAELSIVYLPKQGATEAVPQKQADFVQDALPF